MGKLEQSAQIEEKQPSKNRINIFAENLIARRKKKRQIFSELGSKLKKLRKKPHTTPARKPKDRIPLPKKKPALAEKQEYVTLPMGIKARILSQKEKTHLKIAEAPDKIGPRLRKKGVCPGPKQLAKIRANSEFYNPSKTDTPLVEINEKDLDKVILICGTKENPIKYTLKEFLRIDPKDISDAPPGTYFNRNGEYYRRITRLNPTIIQKFGRLHEEVEKVVSQRLSPEITRILYMVKSAVAWAVPSLKIPVKAPISSQRNVRLYIDENYRSYGENLCNYVKKETPGSDIKYGSRHPAGDALDLQTFILVDGRRVEGREAEDILRDAISEEWKKHGGGRGFYTNHRNFHIDARIGTGQWGPNWPK